MRQIKSLSVLNAISFLIPTGLFYTIHFQVLNLGTARDISVPYHSLLIPPKEITLIIWGVLYTALAIFCLYHITMAFTHREKYPANQDTRRVDMFFIINNLAATGWALTTALGQLITSLILLGFQILLISVIHRELNIYKRYRRMRSTFCTQAPMSIYAAWLSFLFMGGISEFFRLDTAGWHPVLVGILIFITLLVIFIRHNIVFGLMIIPGLVGIISNTDALVKDSRSIIIVAWAGIWILALASFVKLVMDFRLKDPPVVFQRTAYD